MCTVDDSVGYLSICNSLDSLSRILLENVTFSFRQIEEYDPKETSPAHSRQYFIRFYIDTRESAIRLKNIVSAVKKMWLPYLKMK